MQKVEFFSLFVMHIVYFLEIKEFLLPSLFNDAIKHVVHEQNGR